jgi:hypothetical protein
LKAAAKKISLQGVDKRFAATKDAEKKQMPTLSKMPTGTEGNERFRLGIRGRDADARRRLEDIAAVAAAAASARSPSEKEQAIEWLRRREEEEKALSGLKGPFRYCIRPLRIKARQDRHRE